MENKKELVVSAIENGTVIDHIPTEAVYQVIHILNLEDYKDEVLTHKQKLPRKKFPMQIKIMKYRLKPGKRYLKN